MKIAVFAKHLQAFELDECCARVKAAGFDGLDLTVRPGGYVGPGDDLARRMADAVRRVRSHGLDVPLITSGIVRADESAEVVLKTAGELGVREIKLHYWIWPADVAFAGAVESARRDLDQLAPVAAAAGVRINIHNHSDFFVTHTADAVLSLLQDHDPKVAGAYIDPAHFAIEGGLAGWRSAIELLAPRATMLAVKDFRWFDVEGTAEGRPQRPRWVPVGTGLVPWAKAIRLLHDAGFDGPISIHGEYQGKSSWRDLTAGQVLEQCGEDRLQVVKWIGDSDKKHLDSLSH